MREIASFASSEAGQVYARIEQQFGRDPAAFLEDDLLAHNLRAALLYSMAPKTSEEAKDEVKALAERARTKGAQVRGMIDGGD